MDGDRVTGLAVIAAPERDDLCAARSQHNSVGDQGLPGWLRWAWLPGSLTVAEDRFVQGVPALQAARRRTSQTVAAMRSRESASSQPPSIHWNGQNRLAGW